jgi:hypothetical protein
VGSHTLIGAALGTGLWALLSIPIAEPKNMLSPGISLWPLLGTRAWMAAYAYNLQDGLRFGLLEFFAIFGLRVVLKKDWLAAIAASVLFTGVQGGIINDPDWKKQLIIYLVLYGILMLVLLRVGLVTTISTLFFLNAMNRICLGSDFKAWWAPFGFATIFLLVGITCYAFWRSIGARLTVGGAPDFEQ